MLDLLAVVPLDHVGAVVGGGAASLLRGLVDETASNTVTANVGLVILGFVIGLCAEMRKSE
jgi:hypothetical protein